MADEDELYLENLDEFVNDENKIVTYKWLSSTLKVPANKSKEMLQSFAKLQSTKGCQLNLTFLLGGKPTIGDNKQGYKFVIVKEEHLEETRKKFSQVTCCHVYSIQKSKLQNFNILHGVDVDTVKSSLFELKNWSGIYCPEAKQNEDFASKRRQANHENASIPNGCHDTKAPKKDAPESTQKKEVPSKPASSSGKQVTSASFFGSSTNKKKNTAEPKSEKNEKPSSDKSTEKAKETNQKSEKKEISFFGKPIQDRKKAKETPKEKEKKTEAKAEPQNNDEDMDVDVEDDFESFIKTSKGEEVTSKAKDEKKTSSNKGEKRKKEETFEALEFEETTEVKLKKEKERKKESKKESKKGQSKISKKEEKSPSNEEKEKEEPAPKSESTVIEVAEDNKPKEKRRIRRKVLKSKTYMNDEGYMVTEKVYESESASEESEPEDATKKPTKQTNPVHKRPREITEENKKIRAQAAKPKTQASLMSFFKKK
eukprot:Seg2982.2 transcript_id=Seg2982.2/GoldUCD/mRNA.D3Y31 product="DNA polymerase delta subunit 3" protein_id=Seg2982.2/GoldUCD/D3Y31